MSEAIDRRLERIEERLNHLTEEVSYIRGKVDQEMTLIKWVIFPLLFIVAALVGIKLILPT